MMMMEWSRTFNLLASKNIIYIYIYICVCVCVCVCVSVCVSECIFLSIYLYLSIYLWLYVHHFNVCVRVELHESVCVMCRRLYCAFDCTYIYMWACVIIQICASPRYVCASVYMLTYTWKYVSCVVACVYIYIYIYTNAWAFQHGYVHA